MGLTVAVVTAVLALAAIVAATRGRRAFDRAVTTQVVELYRDCPEPTGTLQLEPAIAGLPEPARRYLRHALTDDAPLVTSARIHHRGTFRLRPGPWSPIDGEQYFSLCRPGFVWHATVSLAPLVWLEARDALLDGHGTMRGTVEAAVTVVAAQGPQLDVGALMRWAAEMPWFPQAFLDRRHVQIEGLDSDTMQVTVRDGTLAVSVRVRIDAAGDIVSLEAERPREVRGEMVPTRWTGRYSDYRAVDGAYVPFAVEVSWHLPEGAFPYARFDVDRIEYGHPARWEAPELRP
jgi:hypothetical protein